MPTAGELVASKRQALASVSPATTVREALRVMEKNDIGFLPVLDGENLAGVLSERDIARGAILHDRTVVREIMTVHVHTVSPEAKVPECIALMHAIHVRHLPVARDGTVLGVLSVRDMMGALLERYERLLRRLEDERVTMLFPSPISY